MPASWRALNAGTLKRLGARASPALVLVAGQRPPIAAELAQQAAVTRCRCLSEKGRVGDRPRGLAQTQASKARKLITSRPPVKWKLRPLAWSTWTTTPPSPLPPPTEKYGKSGLSVSVFSSSSGSPSVQ